MLESLAEEFAGKFRLAKVNIDENPELAQEFGVSGIPMVVGVVDGRVADHFVGVLPEEQIRGFIDRLCPSEIDLTIKAAQSVKNANPDEARKLFEQVLVESPDNAAAHLGLAEILIDAGDADAAGEHAARISIGDEQYAAAQNVVARIGFVTAAADLGGVEAVRARCDANPEDLQAKLDLGLALAAAGQFEPALEALLEVVQKDRQFGVEHAKDVMVKIFNLVGQQSALANEYRSKLASALY
jgi:putative thioredoxin